MFDFGDEKIILKHKNKEYSWHDLKKLIIPRAAFLKKSKCKNLLLCCDDHFEFIINFLAGVYAGKEIFLLQDSTKMYLLEGEFITEIKNLEEEFELPEINPEKVFINLFTSGSTSTPKKVHKNLQNVLSEADDMYELFPIDKSLVFVTTTKLTHMFSLTFAFIMPLVKGFVINADVVKFPEQITDKNYVFITSPSFLDMMAKYDNNPQPPKYIFSAGAPLKNSTFKYFEKNSRVVDIYGSTETSTVGYKTSSDAAGLTIWSNVKISTDTDSRLRVKSNYFLEDELTVNDIVEISGNTFKVLNRSDRILKIQEKRISAVELEEYLNRHSLIENSYCFKNGERAAAIVVLTPQGKEELLNTGVPDFTKNLKIHVRKYSEIVPQRWRFLDEIPKTTSGKVDKEKIEKIFGLNLAMPLIFTRNITGNHAEFELTFLRHSNFFKGHFTEIPILPGVVQLFFAHFFAEDSFGKISGSKIKKIKFSKIIKPDTIVKLKLKDNDLSVDYTYTDGENIFSSGTFIK